MAIWVGPELELKKPLDGTASDNTPEGAVIRAGGKHVTKTINLTANNTTETINVFTITGSVVGLSLHGEVSDATTLTNCTDVHFDLWDGTNSIPLTKASPGGDLSGAGVGSWFIKTAIASILLNIHLNDQIRMTEVSGSKTAQEFVITAKAGVTNYLRLIYSTTDTPINAELKIDIEYADKDNGSFTPV